MRRGGSPDREDTIAIRYEFRAVTPRVPLLLDVDTGIDDSLALLYACASPEAELLAVTCVRGNVDARQVAENTRAVLELAGRDDVEVALGREVPLVRAAGDDARDARARAASAMPSCRRRDGRSRSATRADLIVETRAARPGEITLVTLGPLTNLAVALDARARACRGCSRAG